MPAKASTEVDGGNIAPQTTEAFGGRNFAQEDKRIKAELDEQPKVPIMIAQQLDASSDDPLPDVTVNINGYNFQIQRGEHVEVPESVAAVLRDSMEATYTDEKGRTHAARKDLAVMFGRVVE